MKDRDKIIPILVFIITFIAVIVIFFLINNKAKNKYSCYDYENDISYTFKTEEEMNEVCNKLNGGEDDKIMDTYTISDDLLEVEDPDFAFYPYINSNKELNIIIAISNCNNQEKAKEKAIKWFKDNSYNINDYNIEYENSCNIN